MAEKNVIPDRIADALSRFPPFSMLPATEVRALATEAAVRLVPAGDTVWAQGDPPGELLFFLARGRVEYLWKKEGLRPERVDVRDVGDLLGLSALMQVRPFVVSALAVEDSLLYEFPWSRVRALLENHDEARNYARRHIFWVARVGTPVRLPEHEIPLPGGPNTRPRNILQAHLDGGQLIRPRPLDRLLTCKLDAPIQEAANIMAAKRVPSVLVVDERRHPVGMVTSNNLVKAVIVEGVDKNAPVAGVMARPVVTVSPQSSATAAILLMLHERIGQVCVTEDGTPRSPALDVCTHKDLLAQSGHHPAGLLHELRLARSPARFRELCDDMETIARSYLDSGISAIYLGQICAELYGELVQRLVALSSEEVSLPGLEWAWMSVGSDGRREQILRTDMDNAIVFASTGTAAGDEAARSAFLQLANRVIDRMVGAGFARCQGGVMALNPRWCRSSSEWLAELEAPELSGDEGLLRATVLYDLRFVTGSPVLCDRLRDAVFASVAGDPFRQRRLASAVVDTAPLPLNFIGRFVVEKLGGGEKELDLKNRAMAPLRDAARVITLRHCLRRHYSTGGRWDEIQRTLPHYAEIAALAREAYDFLLRLRTLNGLRRGDSGRHLDPGTLTRLERAQLSHVFDVVRIVQSSVRREFDLEARRA